MKLDSIGRDQIYLEGVLSIPLRMKQAWGRIHEVSTQLSFNSFEDETCILFLTAIAIWLYALSIPLRMKRGGGGNLGGFEEDWLSIPLRMKHGFETPSATISADVFQFLWGWNTVTRGVEIATFEAFNSFEDETTLNLVGWSSLIYGQAFNSFEDETRYVTLATS